ncbi:MAG: aldolase/citrate lyase family protein [Acidobacteriota bacterium]
MRFTRKAILDGEVMLGTWLNLGSPQPAEIAGLAGFDWVLIDREHGSGDEKDMSLQILAAQCGATAPIVRVSGIDPAEIKRVLDWGPAGIMAPSIDTPEEAARLLHAVRIPPLGARGAASSTRASRYGFGYQEYLRDANATLVTMVQMESSLAVENVAAIAAIDGVDVLFVGPTDLSISMGVSDSSEGFHAALSRVSEAARGSNKATGILARTQEQAARYRGMGFSVIAIESDRGLLAKGFARAVSAFHATE